MTYTAWDPTGEARQALAAAVDEQGLGALSTPVRLDNLLKDLLPDLPREASLMVAAAEINLAGMLNDRVAAGVDVGTAIRLSAATLGQGRPFDPTACQWVAREFALALGLVSDADADSGWPSGLTPTTAGPPRVEQAEAPPPIPPYQPVQPALPQLLPQWPTPQPPPPPTTPGLPGPGGTAIPAAATAFAPSPEGVPGPRWDPGSDFGHSGRPSPHVGGPSPSPRESRSGPGGPSSPPGGPAGTPGKDTRRALTVATFGLLALIVIIGGVAAALALTHHHSTSSTTTTAATTTVATTSRPAGLGTSTTGGSTTSSSATSSTVEQPAVPAGLTTINGLLAQSAQARIEVSEAEQGVQNCEEEPNGALSAIDAGLAVRQRIATTLMTVKVSGVPGGAQLLANLKAAINDSITADQAFVGWLMDVETANAQGSQGTSACSQYQSDPNWMKANTASMAATVAKTAFVSEWNPLASQYVLRTYAADGF